MTDMSNWDNQYPSAYLKAEERPIGWTARATIKHVVRQAMADGDEKPVMFFRDRTAGLVLNVTNGNIIKQHYGSDMKQWPGKEVIIYRLENVPFQGKLVPGLRIKIPEGAGIPDSRPTEVPQQGLTTEQINQDLAATADDQNIPF